LADSAVSGRIDSSVSEALASGPQRPHQRSGASRCKAHGVGLSSIEEVHRRDTRRLKSSE
jgi:hypothetical protein